MVQIPLMPFFHIPSASPLVTIRKSPLHVLTRRTTEEFELDWDVTLDPATGCGPYTLAGLAIPTGPDWVPPFTYHWWIMRDSTFEGDAFAEFTTVNFSEIIHIIACDGNWTLQVRLQVTDSLYPGNPFHTRLLATNLNAPGPFTIDFDEPATLSFGGITPCGGSTLDLGSSAYIVESVGCLYSATIDYPGVFGTGFWCGMEAYAYFVGTQWGFVCDRLFRNLGSDTLVGRAVYAKSDGLDCPQGDYSLQSSSGDLAGAPSTITLS